MFVDRAKIHCTAGKGGKGCNSYEQSSPKRHPRPTGGDGGRGGSIVLVVRSRVRTLLDVQMRKTFQAEDGKHGGSNNKTGAEGLDERIAIPLGTEVYDDATGHLLRDMCVDEDLLVVCRGGEAGKGSSRHSEATQGQPGETKTIRLELKLIADIGLVGYPNAGKSTLISHMSNAKSRIAAFPFTTKEPVLGVIKGFDEEALVIADIPGLIQGAHEGRGLGHEFLRHIERTKIFVQMVDMAAVDGRDPLEDFKIINEELVSYSRVFAERPRIIVANKMDVPEAKHHLVKFKQSVTEEVLEISAATGQGLDKLTRLMFEMSKKVK